MENSITNFSGFGLNKNAQNHKTFGSAFKVKHQNKDLYYAKKGEPMYKKDMDTDEDGTVTMDEFKEYCDANGISAKQRIHMLEAVAMYRMMCEKKQKEKEEAEENQNSQNDKKEKDSAVKVDLSKFEINPAADTNGDKKITYTELAKHRLSRCRQEYGYSPSEINKN